MKVVGTHPKSTTLENFRSMYETRGVIWVGWVPGVFNFILLSPALAWQNTIAALLYLSLNISSVDNGIGEFSM